MRRRLVLTNEGAGHPIRRLLPPAAPLCEPDVGDNDAKLFLLSFGAFFVSFATLIF